MPTLCCRTDYRGGENRLGGLEFEPPDCLSGGSSPAAAVSLREDDCHRCNEKGPYVRPPAHSLAIRPRLSAYQVKADLINSMFEICGEKRGGITPATVAHGMGPDHVEIELESRVREFAEMVGEHDFAVAPAGSTLAVRQGAQYSSIRAVALTLPPERACAAWNSTVAQWPRNPDYPLWSVDA